MNSNTLSSRDAKPPPRAKVQAQRIWNRDYSPSTNDATRSSPNRKTFSAVSSRSGRKVSPRRVSSAASQRGQQRSTMIATEQKQLEKMKQRQKKEIEAMIQNERRLEEIRERNR